MRRVSCFLISHQVCIYKCWLKVVKKYILVYCKHFLAKKDKASVMLEEQMGFFFFKLATLKLQIKHW